MSDMIRRQDAIDACRSVADNINSPTDQQIGAEYCLDLIKEIPYTESERKWIPVTESLLEDGERVLITHKGGVSFGWYNGSYWERGAPTNHRPLQTVIAWMHLPEPYRGE